MFEWFEIVLPIFFGIVFLYLLTSTGKDKSCSDLDIYEHCGIDGKWKKVNR